MRQEISISWRTHNKAANALVLVVAALSMLCCLGVTWLRVAGLEQKSATNYTLHVYSDLAAQSGLDYAVAKLRERYRTPYELCDRYFEPTQDAQRDWVYLYNGDMGAGISLPESQPSFFAGAVWQGRRFTKLNDSDAGKQAITVKVLDTTAQINLNMQLDPSNAHDDLYIGNINMAFLLNNLSRAVAKSTWYQGSGRDTINGPLHGFGMLIIEKRAALGGFRSKWELIGISDGETTISQEDVRDIWDFLTVYPLTEELSDSLYQKVRPKAPAEESLAYRRDYRSPININTAPKPVLVAALEGLSDGRVIITEEDADKLASAICQYRKESKLFSGWQQLGEFLDSQQKNGGCLAGDPYREVKAALVMAMADPNVSYRVFNACKPLYQSVDKTQLTYGEWLEGAAEATCYTTEFCFFPYGLFEITSLGEELDVSGRTVARAQRYALVRIFDLLEHTTQADFQKGQRNAEWAQKTGDTAFVSANNLQKEIVAEYEPSQYFGFLEPVMYDLSLGTSELDDLASDSLCFKVNFNARNDYTLTADKALASAGQTTPAGSLLNKSGSLSVPNEYVEPNVIDASDFIMIPPHRAIALFIVLQEIPQMPPLAPLEPLSASDPVVQQLISQNLPLPIPAFKALERLSPFMPIPMIPTMSSQFRRLNDVIIYVNRKIADVNIQLQQIIDGNNSSLAAFQNQLNMIIRDINANGITDLQTVNAIIALLNTYIAGQQNIVGAVNQRINEINQSVAHPVPEQLNDVVHMLNRSNTVLWDWQKKIDAKFNQIFAILRNLARLESIYDLQRPQLDRLLEELMQYGLNFSRPVFRLAKDSKGVRAAMLKQTAPIGDLVADGVSFSDSTDYRTLCYSVSGSNAHNNQENLPLEQGSLMFWCKFGDEELNTWRRLFFATSPYKYVEGETMGVGTEKAGYEIGVQMELAMRYVASGRNLEIRLRRKLYAALDPFGAKPPAWGEVASNLPPIPGLGYSDYQTTLRLFYGEGYGIAPHEWYHVAVRWKDYTSPAGNQPIVVSGNFYRGSGGRPEVAHSGPLYNAELFQQAQAKDLLQRQALSALGQLSPLEASETGADCFPKRMYWGTVPNQGNVDSWQITLDDIRISTFTDWDSGCHPTRYLAPVSSQRVSLFQGSFVGVPDATPGPFYSTVRNWDTRFVAGGKPAEVKVTCSNWQYDIEFITHSAPGEPLYQMPAVDDLVLSYQRRKPQYLEYVAD
jgi:hypothetical protein